MNLDKLPGDTDPFQASAASIDRLSDNDKRCWWLECSVWGRLIDMIRRRDIKGAGAASCESGLDIKDEVTSVTVRKPGSAKRLLLKNHSTNRTLSTMLVCSHRSDP